MRQSSKTGTLKITNPQSSRLAGFTDTTLEDASAWTTADGVKQDRGWAYADGSTLDNTSGRYNSYLARTGSLVLPNGPFRTKVLTESEVTVTNNRSMSYTVGSFVAYSDVAGAWRLRGNISLDRGTNITDASITISVAGVTFLNAAGEQTCTANLETDGATGVNGVENVRVLDNSASIFVEKNGSPFSKVRLMFDVVLESKPTWADANLEAYPVVQLFDSTASGALGLPEATDTVSGTITADIQSPLVGQTIESGNYTPGTSGATNGFTGTVEPFRYLKIGNVVQVSGQIRSYTTTAAGATFVDIDLPFASSTAVGNNRVSGQVTSSLGTPSSSTSGIVVTNNSTTNVQLNWESLSTAAQFLAVEFMYELD